MDIRCKRAYRGPALADSRLTPAHGATDDDPDDAVALRDVLRGEFHG